MNSVTAEEIGGGSGGDSLAGYEYQIDVSVWLALDLVLASKLTHELILEPASDEDIEADLTEFEPGRVVSKAPLGDYTLVVQAKLRGGDAWTVAGVKTLLNHGGENRKSASERLGKSTIRYLLVTSAGLNGGTRGLKVRQAGVWPKASAMPKSIVADLPANSAGRVAIVGNQDEERLHSDIKRLLTESFRVPFARWEECLRALREEARIRINRGGSGRWRRDDLERVIRDHEGYIASSPELELYVHPTNWPELRAAMRDRYAALIIGQSGTGKTMATRKLYEELREEIPGLAHVAIKLGPHQLRDDKTLSPVLYDIEDPWGRFDFDPASRPWNDQLAQFFAHATHDRLIIATSRLDVAQTSGALDSVKPWLIGLEAEHYGKKERIQLYRSRVAGLPRELRPVATQAESEVLSKLATPLEIQKFFDALPDIDRQTLKNPAGFISEAINRAHQSSIERTVVDQIEGRGDVRAAAVIWGLLKAADKLSLSALRSIEEGLFDRDTAMSRGVTPLINFFVAARNLRQSEGFVTYYHPRVEAGIEQALSRDELVSRRTLRHLIDNLVSPDGPGETWGVAASARLLLAAARRTELKPTPSAAAAAKIDAWLATRLAEGGKEFESNLQLAAAAGSADSNPAEFARYVLHRPDKSFGGMMMWRAPAHDNAWYDRMHADPVVKSLLETFIREVLPTERDDYPTGFVADAERMATDVTPAYLAAASRAVGFGFIHSDDTIAEGALRDLDGFEAIVDSAVEVLTPTAKDREGWESTRLAIINGEYSDDYAQHISENDDGHTAGEFLKAFVAKVRATKGWPHLAEHRHLTKLTTYWFRQLVNKSRDSEDAIALDPDELAGAFAAGHGGKDEDDLWYVLLRAWDPQYLPALTDRVVGGSMDQATNRAALTCLVERAPGALGQIAEGLVRKGDVARLVQIADDLAYLRNRRSGDGDLHELAATAAAALLPPAYASLSDAVLALAKDGKPTLSDGARTILESLTNPSEEVRHLRVLLSAGNALHVEDDVRWLLANSSEHHIAIDAVVAAIRLGMVTEIEAALDHKFADVKARALTAMSASMPAPLPPRLLAMSSDKGSPVRKALVAILDAKPDPAHLDALLVLAKDDWSRGERYYGEEDDFPIAQDAISVIAKLPSIGAEAVEVLYAIAIDTSDSDVRGPIFTLLAKSAGVSVQDRLFDLAVTPGNVAVRRSAASALLSAGEQVSATVVSRITADLLATRYEPVAVNLTLLLAWLGAVPTVVAIAELLATNPKRRVLLLLIVWLLRDRGDGAAETVAAMLPAQHPALAWALGKKIKNPDDALIADLGEPGICKQVLIYMQPAKT